MQPYLDLLKLVLESGKKKDDRTGTGVISTFGHQMRFDLQKGFPLVTTKKLYLPGIVHELLWFLKGDTSINYLNENNVRIWNAWADENGELGPVYGKQWRAWETKEGHTIDQISWVINEIKTNPNSRRLIVSAWNVGELDQMALMPCHLLFQFYVVDNRLSCKLTQRSADMFLGVPFNIASYSLLTHMIAQQCDCDVGEFIWSGGDTHIYTNHLDQVKEQLSRKPFPLPQLVINRKPDTIFDYQYSDFEFKHYQFHPAIKGAVAV